MQYTSKFEEKVSRFCDFLGAHGIKCRFSHEYGFNPDIWQRVYIKTIDCDGILKFCNGELYSKKYYLEKKEHRDKISAILNNAKIYVNSENEIDFEENHPQEEKAMETHQIVNSLYKNLKVVQVVFNQINSDLKDLAGQTRAKKYSYKTFLDLVEGDSCVVEANGEFKVVTVVGNKKHDLEKMKLKWVIQKIDTSDYEALLEAEEKAEEQVHEMIMEKRRQENAEKLKEFFQGQENALENVTKTLNHQEVKNGN